MLKPQAKFGVDFFLLFAKLVYLLGGKMRKQKVLFDVHGCLADFVGGCVGSVQSKFPDIVWDKTHVVDWNFWHSIPSQPAREHILDHMKQRDFISNLPLIQEGLDVYEKLASLGHDIRICTAPLPGKDEFDSKQAVRKWIRNHLGNYTAKRMLFSFDKTQIPADVIIDDKPDLTADKLEVRFKHWVIVDHLYNKNLPETTKLFPIARINNDWSNHEEVLTKLELI